MIQAKVPPATIAVPPIAAEQRLTLNNVSWETYEQILDALGEHRAAQITYSEGILEFMVPYRSPREPKRHHWSIYPHLGG
jgi:Uma2 family endonuclease